MKQRLESEEDTNMLVNRILDLIEDANPFSARPIPAPIAISRVRPLKPSDEIFNAKVVVLSVVVAVGVTVLCVALANKK